MAFWGLAGGAEPLRQHRWYINFGSLSSLTTDSTGLDSARYALKKTDKPKAKVGEITHKYLNHFFYYPGRLEWEAINITFASLTKPSVDFIFKDILQSAGYGVPTKNDKASDYATIGKNKFNKAIGNFDLIQINPEGEEIEKWTIYNPFFTSVQFGALDYGAEEIVEVTCTVRYDYAKLEKPTALEQINPDPDTGNYPGKPA